MSSNKRVRWSHEERETLKVGLHSALFCLGPEAHTISLLNLAQKLLPAHRRRVFTPNSVQGEKKFVGAARAGYWSSLHPQEEQREQPQEQMPPDLAKRIAEEVVEILVNRLMRKGGL